MKKIIYLLTIVALISCSKEQDKVVSLELTVKKTGIPQSGLIINCYYDWTCSKIIESGKTNSDGIVRYTELQDKLYTTTDSLGTVLYSCVVSINGDIETYMLKIGVNKKEYDIK